MYELEPDTKASVRILIAEDNVMNQKVVTKILHKIGFRSTMANNGQEAVDIYVSAALEGKPFDLILMDLQMPVMDGLMSTRKILEYCASDRNKDGFTPFIVALTADVASSVVEECKSCEMHGFISKPIKRDKLMDLLEEVCSWVAEGRVATRKRNFFATPHGLCA